MIELYAADLLFGNNDTKYVRKEKKNDRDQR